MNTLRSIRISLIRTTLLIGIVVLFLLARPVRTDAAVVADAAATANTGATWQTSLTIPSFAVSGNNLLLIVGVAIQQTGGQYVTSVSYGSDSLSLVGTAGNSGVIRTELWQVLNPTVGTANVVINVSGNARFAAGVQLFTGVDQTMPLGTYGSANGNSTSPSVTVSSDTGEMVVDVVGNRYDTQPSTGSGQTLQWTDATISSTVYRNARASSSIEAGASSVTMSWTLSTARNWGIVAVPIKPHIDDVEPDDFNYAKMITIDRTKVGVPGTSTTQLIDYPMLISVVDPDLATVANGGYVENSNGYDIMFRGRSTEVCGPAANTCQLSHEFEKYDPATGEMVVWVKIPYLNTNAKTIDPWIWIYFGNSAILYPLEDPEGVWDSDFEAVWHMSDNEASTTIVNSTSVDTPGDGVADANTSTKSTTGQINDALSFNGSSDYIYQSSTSSIDNPQHYTLSVWIKTGTASGHKVIGFDANRTGTSSGNKDRQLYIGTDGNAYAACYNSAVYTAISNNGVTDNSWHYLVGHFNDADNNVNLYVDGVLNNSTPVGGGCQSYNGYWRMGSYKTSGWPNASDGYYTGNIDETRISSSIRSADWIITDYNSQGSPSTFYSIGDLQESPVTLIELISFTAVNYYGVVQLEWKTGYEVDNLGFRVYREDNGRMIRVTPSMIAGSSLLSRDNVALTSGRTYVWEDFVGTSAKVPVYWLEDVGTEGKSTWHGPVIATARGMEIPRQLRSIVLSHLGEGASKLRSDGSDRNYRRGKAARIRIPDLASRQVPDLTMFSSAAYRMYRKDELTVQSDPSKQASIKILVDRPGWYRLTQLELVQAGLSPLADPENLQLYVDGIQQSIVVSNCDNFPRPSVRRDVPWRKTWINRIHHQSCERTFDEDDWIEFYGTGLDTPWTDTRTYWLVEGSQPGKRMAAVTRTGVNSGISSLLTTVELEPKLIYWSGLRNGDGDNFFGPVVSPAGNDQIIALDHLDSSASGDGILEVRLQGVTDALHSVRVAVNGKVVGSLTFEGKTAVSESFSLPQGVLVPGENIFRLVALNPDADISLMDYIRVSYWRTLETDEDFLPITISGNRTITAGGFSTPEIRAIDVTDPAAPEEYMGTVTPDGDRYAITISLRDSDIRNVYLFADTQIQEPAAVKPNKPSDWYGMSGGADVVIISHGDFIESLQSLKDQYRAEGYRVILADVEDLYDEFSYGHKTPYAIKDFLAKAMVDWRIKPRYLLLVGDASFDPKNLLGLGDFDYMPTKLIDTELLETASDDWFADFDEDGVAEIAVGRLPVRTPEEAALQVDKIAAYKQTGLRGELGDWAERVVLVADSDSEYDFESASDLMSGLVPEALEKDKIYLGQMDEATARERLLQSLNEGTLLVNYFGHGSVGLWRGGLLSVDDLAELNNGNRLPLLVAMTCLNGFFSDIYTESLAEAFLKAPNGGAVGVWASSGLTDTQYQHTMNLEFFRQIFNGRTVGEAVMRAKEAVSNPDVRKTWIYFGDPTIRLPF